VRRAAVERGVSLHPGLAPPPRVRRERRAHWSIPDPARDGALPAFERTAAELQSRIAFLIAAITQEVTGRPPR
jgi:protein-tyrosine-phosphatase